MFPGIMTPDSFHTLSYAKGTLPLSDVHSTFYSLYVKFVSLNGTAIYLVTFISLILSMYALILIIRILFAKYSSTLQYFIAGLLFITPFFGAISVTVWKDSLYVPLIIIGAVHLVRGITGNSGDSNRKINNFLIGFISIFTSSLLRHEGSYVILFVALIILAGGRFHCSKSLNYSSYVKLSFSLILIALFALLSSSQLNEFTKTIPRPAWQSNMSFLMDLQYVNSTKPDVLLPQTRRVLDEISQGGSLNSAKICSGAFDFLGDGFNEKLANQFAGQIIKIWTEEMLAESREYILEARFCRARSALPPLLSTPPTAGWWPTVGIGPNTLDIERPKWAEFTYPVGYFWNYIWKNNGSVIAWPGLHLFIILIIGINRRAGLEIFTSNAIKIVFVFVMVRFTLIPNLAVSQEFRYYSLVYYLSLPIMFLYFYEIYIRTSKNSK